MDRAGTAMLLEDMIEETTNVWGVRVERVELYYKLFFISGFKLLKLKIFF